MHVQEPTNVVLEQGHSKREDAKRARGVAKAAPRVTLELTRDSAAVRADVERGEKNESNWNVE